MKTKLTFDPLEQRKKTLSFIFSTFSFCTYTICESMLIYFSAPTREHIVDAMLMCTVLYCTICMGIPLTFLLCIHEQ